MRFSEKTAVVTGAATGIGQAVALAFAKERANVVLVDVNQKAAAATLELIEAEGGKGIVVIADVSSGADAQCIADQAVAAYGTIDYLVASAGIQTYGTVVDTDEEVWDRTLAVNLKGIYPCCQILHSADDQGRWWRHRQRGFGAGLDEPTQCCRLCSIKGCDNCHDAYHGP